MLEPPHSFKSVTKLHIQANQVLYCLTVSGFTTLEENRRKYNTVEFYVIFYSRYAAMIMYFFYIIIIIMHYI